MANGTGICIRCHSGHDRNSEYCSVRCYQLHRQELNPTYVVWRSLKQRCTNPKNTAYLNYGGRAITMDPSWDDYSQFERDMGKRPSPDATLDRIDNSKGYCKDNCEWRTFKQQMNNRRSNITFLLNGTDVITLQQLCDRLKPNLSQRERHNYYYNSYSKLFLTKKSRTPKEIFGLDVVMI